MVKDKKSCNILVIEDNPGDYLLVEDYLTEKILLPIIKLATNFKEASTILSNGEIRLDVILLDLSLKDKSGEDLITAMLEIASSIPIIILTGYSDIEFSTKSISQGISDYLIKDELTPTTLYKSVIYAIERRKAHAQLKESEKRYSDLFHLSPQPMWVYDVHSLRFLNVNMAAIRSYGYSEEEFLSFTIKDIRPEEDIPRLDEVLKFNEDYNHQFSNGIYRHKKKNGEIINVEVQSNTFYFKRKKARVVLANDITERMLYLNTVEEQNKKLQEIAWTQSHIVRAPLARMMGIVNLIKEMKLFTPEEYEEWLTHFLDSGNELDSIIQDIVKKTEHINTHLTQKKNEKT